MAIGRRADHRYHPSLEARNAFSSKATLTLIGLVVGVIVGVQLTSSQTWQPYPTTQLTASSLQGGGGGAAADSLYRFLDREPSTTSSHSKASGATTVMDKDLAAIIKDYPAAANDIRAGDQPWPKPLSNTELNKWLDILANYTGTSPKPLEPRVGDDRDVEKHWSAWQNFPIGERASSIKEYINQGKCKHANLYLSHILHRLQPWSNGGITQWMVDRSAELGHQRSNFASLTYQIIDDRVFGNQRGNRLYIENYAVLFYEVVRHMKIPNMEFALHNGLDLPVMLKHEPNPMMAYATSDAHSEVLVPCPWYVMDLAAEIAHHSENGREIMPYDEWINRSPSVFWRGSPNDFFPLNFKNWRFSPRLKLVEEGLKRPDLIDAQITSAVFFLGQFDGWQFECHLYKHWELKVDGEEECNGDNWQVYRKAQEAKGTPVGDTKGARYVVNLDGTGVSERYASQLASDQLVFKVHSPFYNYYSPFFLPWKHYVPVKYDMSDLAEKIEWANAHPEQAYKIMVNGQTLAREILHPNDVMCHVGLTLTSYARLMGYKTELRDDVRAFEGLS